MSTTFHHPFKLAQLFGTLDHLSNGRAAWNLVTSSIREQNFGPVVFTALATLTEARRFTETIRTRAGRDLQPPHTRGAHAAGTDPGRAGHRALAGRRDTLAARRRGRETVPGRVLDVLSLGGLVDDRTHDFVVNGLLHELRRRGIVKPDYVGAALRENLGLQPSA